MKRYMVKIRTALMFVEYTEQGIMAVIQQKAYELFDEPCSVSVIEL